MNLKQIIGQLFIIGFQGDRFNEESNIAEDITTRNLGGVILFDRFLAENAEKNNISSPSQLSRLNQSLQDYAENRLLITIDQEGGKVCRLKEKYGFPPSLSAKEMGSHEDTGLSTSQAETVASTLAASGINLNFAPVADLEANIDNPIIAKLQRSFSADSAKVTEHCRIWLDCHKRHGVLGCLKHFPGHGSSKGDSHLGFVDISKSWQRSELTPYRELIEEKKVDAIMMGHLFHNGLDGVYPASLSATIVGEVLRNELGFDGAVITDDMQMKAITDRYGFHQAIVLALSAGVDLIVIGNNLEYDADVLQGAIRAVCDAVDKKELSADILFRAYERVQHLKNILFQ